MEYKEINEEDLRRILYIAHYGKGFAKMYDKKYGDGKFRNEYMSRKLIIKKIYDNYGKLATIYFSLNGSPPKGRAVLIKNYDVDERTPIGDLLVIGNTNKWVEGVKIII